MIRARGLQQTFHTKQGRQRREVRAVDGVDLDIEDGEVVGFLGPNGAGKTTTLRMLTTLLRPTAGEATVAGWYDGGSPLDVLQRPQTPLEVPVQIGRHHARCLTQRSWVGRRDDVPVACQQGAQHVEGAGRR